MYILLYILYSYIMYILYISILVYIRNIFILYILRIHRDDKDSNFKALLTGPGFGAAATSTFTTSTTSVSTSTTLPIAHDHTEQQALPTVNDSNYSNHVDESDTAVKLGRSEVCLYVCTQIRLYDDMIYSVDYMLYEYIH